MRGRRGGRGQCGESSPGGCGVSCHVAGDVVQGLLLDSPVPEGLEGLIRGAGGEDQGAKHDVEGAGH
eukprot:11014938-Alexandrium_andersonii.AAC.1